MEEGVERVRLLDIQVSVEYLIDVASMNLTAAEHFWPILIWRLMKTKCTFGDFI